MRRGMIVGALVGVVCMGLTFHASAATKRAPKRPKTEGEVRVTFETSKGNFTCVLYSKQAPKTVANFVGLAEGTKEWTDSNTGRKVKKPLYDGTIFHRVIPDFMVQGGDPLGNGTGGPGYEFQDEFSSDLTFDKPGKLAMANRGPNTNGSQFFVTVAATPWLNGRHTIFGHVVEGQNVVDAIVNVKRGANDKPVEPVVVKKIVVKKPSAAAPENR